MVQTTIHRDFANGASAHSSTSTTVDKSHFTCPQYMTQEWDNIWTRTWLFAGLESDLKNSGDYFVYELGRESIVIMRDNNGDIACYYNVCQHRGNRILTSKSGCVKSVTCPYHGWRYQLDGTLKTVPDRLRFREKVSPEDHSLKPVKHEVWAGLVWINMDLNAAPLKNYLGSFMSELSPFHFENMVLTKHQTVRLDANWKTVKDNFLEQYHVDFIHPQHASFVDCFNSQNTLWPFGHSSTHVKGLTTNPRYTTPGDVPQYLCNILEGLGLSSDDFNGRVPDIRKAVQDKKRQLSSTMSRVYSDLSDEQLSDVWQYDVFPNLFMTVQAEEVSIYGPRPHASDPNKCLFDKWTLQIPTERGHDGTQGIRLHPDLTTSLEDKRPQHDTFDRSAVVSGEQSLTITFDQDISYLPDMQAGMHSRGFERALLNQDESRIQHFHDWLTSWMHDIPDHLK